MIINTGQMCIVNYPGRPRMRDSKCPDWEKKYVVGLVDQKKKKRKTYSISRDNFLFHSVINNVSPFP